MRWTIYLGGDPNAYKSFEEYINDSIKHHHESLERPTCIPAHHQGAVATLRQILLDLETENKEHKTDGYITEGQSPGT